MIEPIRLLAFAFAGADLLFEIDRTGVILFATGAASGFSDQGDLEGRYAADLFLAGERARFSIIVRGLSPGERVGPLPMTLASGEKATLAMCYLPQRDRIACTLVKPGKRSAMGLGGVDPATGLADKNAFLEAAAKNTGGTGTLALVNLPGLSEACASLSPPDASALMSAIGERVKAVDTLIAARLSDNGFGVVTRDAKSAGGLAERLLSAIRDWGFKNIQAEEVRLSLKGRNLSPEQSLLALRYVIGRFAEGKLKPIPGADLSTIFETVMAETMARAQSFHTTVADGAFDLVFEPIVSLKTGSTAYYEALTRFEPGVSPAETICFAEDLGMADSLDIAVALKAFGLLERDVAVTTGVAINVSGPSIAKPSSFAMLEGLLAKKRALAKRIRIEITETSEIPDLAAADKSIQSLRQMGYRVGIDDFGSGAASLQYLHGLNVDFVKVDGSLIQRLGKSPRDDALLKGVLASCNEMGVDTVAEWIDSQDLYRRCAEIGFRYGQGRHFGEPLTALPRDVNYAPVRGRRMGTQESWQ